MLTRQVRKQMRKQLRAERKLEALVKYRNATSNQIRLQLQEYRLNYGDNFFIQRLIGDYQK